MLLYASPASDWCRANMEFVVRRFVEQFHVRIWEITEIRSHWGVSTNWLLIRKVTANANVILLIIFATSLCNNLLYGDTTDKTYISTILLYAVLVTTKYCLFRYQPDRVDEAMQLVFQIERLITSRRDEFEQRLLNRRTHLFKLIAMVNCAIVACAVGAKIFLSCSSEDRELILPTRLPQWINWQGEDWIFAMCTIWHLITITYMWLLSLTLDFFGPTIYIVLDAYWAILDRRMRSIGWQSSTKQLDAFQDELLCCYRYHKLCLS